MKFQKFFYRKPSLRIALRYSSIVSVLMVAFSILMPKLLNYGPESINTDFDIQMSYIPYWAQFLLISLLLIGLIISTTHYLFRSVDKFYISTDPNKYDDIIDLPHPVSARRAGMPLSDRAAQFSPFSALTGYEDVIEESGRLTELSTELTESAWERINKKLYFLWENAAQHPCVTVTYFVPDERKSGGKYVTVTGQVKRVDDCQQLLRLTDGREIPLKDIYELMLNDK